MALEEFFTLSAQEMMYQLLLPFLIIFVILWGILSKLNLFERKVNLVLSLSLSIIATSTEAFAMLSNYMTEISGYTVLIAFTALFIFGVATWSLRTGGEIYGIHEPISRREKRILKEMEKVNKKLKKAKGAKKDRLLKEIKILEDELKVAEAKRKY